MTLEKLSLRDLVEYKFKLRGQKNYSVTFFLTDGKLIFKIFYPWNLKSKQVRGIRDENNVEKYVEMIHIFKLLKYYADEVYVRSFHENQSVSWHLLNG